MPPIGETSYVASFDEDPVLNGLDAQFTMAGNTISSLLAGLARPPETGGNMMALLTAMMARREETGHYEPPPPPPDTSAQDAQTMAMVNQSLAALSQSTAAIGAAAAGGGRTAPSAPETPLPAAEAPADSTVSAPEPASTSVSTSSTTATSTETPTETPVPAADAPPPPPVHRTRGATRDDDPPRADGTGGALTPPVLGAPRSGGRGPSLGGAELAPLDPSLTPIGSDPLALPDPGAFTLTPP